MSDGLRAAIAGIGAYVPPKIISNADLERLVDTTDEWITQRTGIKQRHAVGPDESTATLAAEAGRRACRSAGARRVCRSAAARRA